MRTHRMIGAFVAAVVIDSAALAAAQGPSLGRYSMEWATLQTGQFVDLTNGARVIDLETAGTSCPPSSAKMVRNATGVNDVWCLLDDGTFDQSAGTHAGFVQAFQPNGAGGFDGFYVEAEHGSRAQSITHAVGRRVAAAPAPPPSTGGGLTVTMTAPRAGAVATGNTWVTAWCGGCSGAANVYVLLVDDVERAKLTSPSRGPVSLVWNSKLVPNGGHTITVKGTDTGGRTGASSRVSITVRN
jgi:hypothetical protein